MQSVIEVYEDILQGKRRSMPHGAWQDIETVKRIIKYLVEEKLNLSDEDIKEKWGRALLIKWKLGGLLNNIFNNSPYAVFNVAYPDRFKPWEFNVSPQGYWTEETGKLATKWMIEDKLQWSVDEVKLSLRQQTFRDFGLGGMLQVAFHSSPYRAVDTAYPGVYKPWDLAHSPNNTWAEEDAISLVKWLIEEKLQWSLDDVKKKISKQTFVDNNLGGLLQSKFFNSPYKAVNAVYPGQVQPWELNVAPNHYWNEGTGRKAMKWLIEERLKWSDEDIKNSLTGEVIIANDLNGMLQIVYGGSVYDAIDALYKDRFRPWELKKSPQNTWSKEGARQAVKWLVEEKLGWTAAKAYKNLQEKHFEQYGIIALVYTVYDYRIKNALDDTYPSK